MSGSEPAVVVLGASGILGSRIVTLLEQALPDRRVIGAGRHPAAAGTAEARFLDLEDPASFAKALADTALLVHAAGPYDHDVRPLVETCLAADIDYVDLAEDVDFVRRVRRAARGAESAARLVPGCSTVPGLVGVLARCFEGRDEVTDLEVYLSLGARNPVGPGLLYGLLRPLGAPSPLGEPWFRSLRTFTFRDGLERSFGSYPIALPDGAFRKVGADLPVRLFVGFDRGALNQLLVGASRLVPRLSREALQALVHRALPLARAAAGAGCDGAGAGTRGDRGRARGSRRSGASGGLGGPLPVGGRRGRAPWCAAPRRARVATVRPGLASRTGVYGPRGHELNAACADAGFEGGPSC
jgi:hypothetical protein